MRLRSVCRSIGVLAAFASAGLLGATAAVMLVAGRHQMAITEMRRLHPGRMVCGNGLVEMQFLTALFGAIVAIVVLESLRRRGR